MSLCVRGSDVCVVKPPLSLCVVFCLSVHTSFSRPHPECGGRHDDASDPDHHHPLTPLHVVAGSPHSPSPPLAQLSSHNSMNLSRTSCGSLQNLQLFSLVTLAHTHSKQPTLEHTSLFVALIRYLDPHRRSEIIGGCFSIPKNCLDDVSRRSHSKQLYICTHCNQHNTLQWHPIKESYTLILVRASVDGHTRGPPCYNWMKSAYHFERTAVCIPILSGEVR